MGTQSTWGHRLRVFCRTDPSPERIHPWIWRARYRFPPRNPEYCRNGGPCVHRLPQGRRNNVKESVNCGRTVKRKLSRLHHVATYLILRKKAHYIQYSTLLISNQKESAMVCGRF